MKCDNCNGIGAYSYIPEQTKEEREDGNSIPSRLRYTPSKITTICPKCNGTGDYEERMFRKEMEQEINQLKKDVFDGRQ